MTTTKEGLHLLAGPQGLYPYKPQASELARLFDLLVKHYRFVIVDASSRLDPTTKLRSDLSDAVLVMAQTDVVSLWSAGRIHSFLEEGMARDRIRIVLNRYKKVPGFGDEDVQQVTNCKVLWKIPNAFQAIQPSIDRGRLVVLQEESHISRSYRGLAAALGGESLSSPAHHGTHDGGPEGGDAAGVAVEKPKRPGVATDRRVKKNRSTCMLIVPQQ